MKFNPFGPTNRVSQAFAHAALQPEVESVVHFATIRLESYLPWKVTYLGKLPTLESYLSWKVTYRFLRPHSDLESSRADSEESYWTKSQKSKRVTENTEEKHT